MWAGSTRMPPSPQGMPECQWGGGCTPYVPAGMQSARPHGTFLPPFASSCLPCSLPSRHDTQKLRHSPQLPPCPLPVQLRPVEWANIVFTSAVTGQRVKRVLDAVTAAAEEHRRRVTTATLNLVLSDAVGWRAPPSTGSGKRGRIYYATQVGGAGGGRERGEEGGRGEDFMRLIGWVGCQQGEKAEGGGGREELFAS